MDASVAPHAFVPDLEDSVPFSKKDEARDILGEFLSKEVDEVIENGHTNEPFRLSNGAILIPRVNSEPQYFEKDLRAILSSKIYAITVGKTDTREDIERFQRILSQVEQDLGLEHKVKLIPTIESAKALQNIREILQDIPLERRLGVAFGADDYASDLGFTRDTSPLLNRQRDTEFELDYVRFSIGAHARAQNLQSYDTPNVNFKNEQQHQKEAGAVKRMGFSGKFAIHPNQIAVLNSVFGVTKEQYDEAMKVIEAYEKAVSEHSRGSLQIDGRMVDQPVLKQYQNVITQWYLQNRGK